jgi:hypothetical protein
MIEGALNVVLVTHVSIFRGGLIVSTEGSSPAEHSLLGRHFVTLSVLSHGRAYNESVLRSGLTNLDLFPFSCGRASTASSHERRGKRRFTGSIPDSAIRSITCEAREKPPEYPFRAPFRVSFPKGQPFKKTEETIQFTGRVY